MMPSVALYKRSNLNFSKLWNRFSSSVSCVSWNIPNIIAGNSEYLFHTQQWFPPYPISKADGLWRTGCIYKWNHKKHMSVRIVRVDAIKYRKSASIQNIHLISGVFLFSLLFFGFENWLNKWRLSWRISEEINLWCTTSTSVWKRILAQTGREERMDGWIERTDRG